MRTIFSWSHSGHLFEGAIEMRHVVETAHIATSGYAFLCGYQQVLRNLYAESLQVFHYSFSGISFEHRAKRTTVHTDIFGQHVYIDVMVVVATDIYLSSLSYLTGGRCCKAACNSVVSVFLNGDKQLEKRCNTFHS